MRTILEILGENGFPRQAQEPSAADVQEQLMDIVYRERRGQRVRRSVDRSTDDQERAPGGDRFVDSLEPRG